MMMRLSAKQISKPAKRSHYNKARQLFSDEAYRPCCRASSRQSNAIAVTPNALTRRFAG